MPSDATRRGAGVADRAGLENRCGGNATEGSNPSLSALFQHDLVTSCSCKRLRGLLVWWKPICETFCGNRALSNAGYEKGFPTCLARPTNVPDTGPPHEWWTPS